jgi:Cu-processing system permease protein
MTTAEAQIPTVTEHPQASLVFTIARKELRDAVRGRWFWFYAAGFAIVASTLAMVALPGSQVSGFGSFGRTAASLVALVQLIVPLMGLTLGAQSLAGQSERGTLRYLLSHPVSRTEAFLGTYLGLLAALFATVAGGFGAAGLITALRGSGTNAGAFVRIALLSWVLAAAMLGVGMLISAMVRKGSSALGIAVFAWLALAFLGDLGIMGTAVATRLPAGALFASALLNPIEAFRLAALTSFSGSLDVLGPVGSYAIDRFGAALDPLIFAALVIWTIIPVAAAWWFFTRRKDL